MVEDDVDLSSICYPFDFAGYVLSMMVENKICSQFLSFVSLSLAPNGSNDFRVQQLISCSIQPFSALECSIPRPPTSATSPEMSEPDMCGRGTLSLLVPPLAQMSRWFSAHALTLTRTSVGPIFGLGTSSN